MELPSEVLKIIETLEKNGYEAYAVGGCVRDSIIGNTPKDWDVCTSAHPEKVIDIFQSFRVIETGLKHGTVTILIDMNPVEVTTYRIDGEYENNRQPSQVKFVTSLKEDLARRDFTMNALAYNPKTGLIDYFDGRSDIKENLIRCVGNPTDRIKEDALRILRTLRFSSRFNFLIEESLSHSIHKYSNLLSKISSERIRSEFNGILLGENSFDVLTKYRDVISIFIPEVKNMFGFKQNNPYHHLDVWEHTLKSVEMAPDNLIVKLAMFFHDIGKPLTYSIDEDGISHFYGHPNKSVKITETILKRLKYSNQIISDVLSLIKYHDIVLTEKNLLRWMNKIGEARVALLLDVMTADIKAQAPEYLEDRINQLSDLRKKYEQTLADNLCFKISDLAIDGQDLVERGYPQGKEIGDILNLVLNAVMDGKIGNDKDVIIGKLAQIIDGKI